MVSLLKSLAHSTAGKHIEFMRIKDFLYFKNDNIFHINDRLKVLTSLQRRLFGIRLTVPLRAKNNEVLTSI